MKRLLSRALGGFRRPGTDVPALAEASPQAILAVDAPSHEPPEIETPAVFEAEEACASVGIRPLPKPGSVDYPTVRQRYIERRGFILTDIITELLPADERFVIIDGGAREAFADPRWRCLDRTRVRLYGFEPDASEVEKLNAEAAAQGLNFRYFPGALWGEPREVTFYENKSPGGGSCYPQNTDLTHRWKFQNRTDAIPSRDIFYPVGTSTWPTTTLDAWSAERGGVDIDFMKLNVQGAELEILKGAETLIATTLGLMTEVSFVESYRERPFFSDIDAHLRARGFRFFDLIGLHYMGRIDSPVTASHLPGLYPLWGQLIEAHGIYFRDPIDAERCGERPLERLSATKLLKLVAFAELFGQIEYAFELIAWLAGKSELEPALEEWRPALTALLTEGERRYKTLMV